MEAITMTEVLYMGEWTGDESVQNPNYIREFDAKITKRGETYVVLDRTAFYALGGGQPSDTGKLRWDGGETKVTENQIHADHSRVDFQPIKFEDEDLEKVEKDCNEIISKGVPVHVYEETRPALEEKMTEQRYILNMIPKSIPKLRVIDILGVDICPCAGTHVKNTSELGKVHILERRSKGKDIDRIVYELL
jgi:Ser-tRNA(Ala) deacylase AlaX